MTIEKLMGLTTVVKRAFQLCSANQLSSVSSANWDDEVVDEDEEDDATIMANTEKQQRYIADIINVLLIFYCGVVQGQVEWMDGQILEKPVIIEATGLNGKQREGIYIGFLLNISSQCVALLTDSEVRAAKMTAIVHQILSVASDVREILTHIHTERHRMFCINKREAVRDFCSGKTKVSKRDTSEKDNSNTSQAMQQLSSPAVSNYIQTAAQFVNSQTYSVAPPAWEESIPWDQVTDEAVHTLRHIHSLPPLHGAQVTALESHSTGEQYKAINFFSDKSDSCAISTTLPWTVTGVAMVVHSMLQGELLSIEQTLRLPQVFAPRYLHEVCAVYLTALIRNSQLATHEGLRFSCLLGDLSGAYSVQPGDLRLFLPFGTPLSEGEGVRRLLDAFYSSQQYAEKDSGRRADIALVAASSTDSLSVCQAVITALASCTDNQLRMDALAALRVFLRRMEERSLFALLLRLIDQCPFLSITGLLIDILKECSQAVSLSKAWGHFTVNKTSRNSSSSTGEKNWLSVFQTAAESGGPSSLSLLFSSSCPSSELTWRAFSQFLSDQAPPLRDHVSSAQFLASSEKSVASKRARKYEDSDERRAREAHQQRVKLELESLLFSWGAMEASPWWSPLVLRGAALTRLEEFTTLASADALLDSVDVVGSVVNLVQFVALRLNTGIALDEDDISEAPILSIDTSGASCLQMYFAGCSPDSISVVSAVQDVVHTSRLMRQLQQRVEGLLEELTVRAKGRQNLDLLKVQLLAANVRYVTERVERVSSSLCWIVSHQ
eukprot:gene21305-27335_t